MNNDITSNEPQPEPAATGLIVFGRGDSGKPHASWFDMADADRAERAAGLMGMRVLRLLNDQDAATADGLPTGRVFASGRAFVPFVRASVYAQLDAAPGAFTPARPPDAEMPTGGPAKGKGRGRAMAATEAPDDLRSDASDPAEPPVDWDGIAVGHAVLAAEEGDPNTWFLAVVVGRRDDNLLQLRWGGEWVDEPLFLRRREHLALLPPDSLPWPGEP